MKIKRKGSAAWRGGLKDDKGSISTESGPPNPVSAPRDSNVTGGSATFDAVAFPKLDMSDLAALAPLADLCSFEDGQTVFRAGDADLDLFVVESGAIEILNPSDNSPIVTHGPGQFAGDIDLLTRRPVIVTGVARGPTRLMRVPGERLREMLNKVPHVRKSR